MAFFISFFLHCLSVLLALTNFANAKSLVPCYFIFGDSASDNGNNNHLSTLAKVDYYPYGIDFPKGPTGRFGNGRTIHDFIAGHLGFELGQFIPPYADTRNQDIHKGVNYASGSVGIRDETGKHLGANVHLNQQIKNHKTIIKKITNLMKNSSATKLLLNQCLYSVGIGSNDYLNNYFLPKQYNTSHNNVTLLEYTTLLVEQLSVQLTALYNTGARKIAVYAIGPLGETPYTKWICKGKRPGCVHKLNQGAKGFNDQLSQLVKLNNNLSDAIFTYINPQGIGLNLSSFDWTNPCCKIGGGGGELCLNNSTPCMNRKLHIFWDGVHPTEAWNEIAAHVAYSSGHKEEADPFNIQKLVTQKTSSSVWSLD